MGELRVEIRAALLQRARSLTEARHGGVHELRFGPEPVEEQPEEPVGDRPAIGHGVAAPGHPFGHDRAARHHRHRQVAIDPLLRREVVVRHGTETAAPVGGPGLPAVEGLGRKVVETVVELG